MVFTEVRSDTGLSSYRLDKPQGAFIKALVWYTPESNQS